MSEEPLRRGPGRPPRQLSETPSDAELGIGEPDEHDAAQSSINALLAHPDIARLIDAAVAQRLAAVGAPQPDSGLAAIITGIDRLTTMHAAQAPGYYKPLQAGEMERRASGLVDMQTAIEMCKADGVLPRYRLVGEPLFAGEIEYRADSEIETLIFPNEHMMPLNEQARMVHEAMMRWIGGEQLGIAERVEKAEQERHGQAPPDYGAPFHRPGLPEQSPVAVVAEPRDERAFDPRRPPQAAHQVNQVYRVG